MRCLIEHFGHFDLVSMLLCIVQPLLCIDATSLYGKYKEYLMIATTVDGNCQILPIAFALIKSESQDTWGWFLGWLLDSAKERNERITLISDRHPGKYIYK
jgi:zinc finger SWIM domain-containing protein 3